MCLFINREAYVSMFDDCHYLFIDRLQRSKKVFDIEVFEFSGEVYFETLNDLVSLCRIRWKEYVN